MKKHFTILSLLLLLSIQTKSQCTILPNAVAGLTLTFQVTSAWNASGVAYNPTQNLYYSAEAGNPTFPLETWTSAGVQLYTTTAAFDWRGMWWNPNMNRLEGNGYFTYGMWRTNLNGSGWALNSGANLNTGQNQPNDQVCGDYDYAANQVLYYYNGRIYKYTYPGGAAVTNFAITGTPVAIGNLNWTTLVYTGCTGMEVGLLDYVNKRVYFYDKNTGAYVGMSQLPALAITAAAFRTSWANGLFWLYDQPTHRWTSYQVTSNVLPFQDLTFDVTPVKADANLTWTLNGEEDITSYEVQRSIDAVNFSKIGTVMNSRQNSYDFADHSVPGLKTVWYRLKLISANGEESFSGVRFIERMENDAQTSFIHVFPNPAVDQVYFTIQSTEDPQWEISITDVNGKIISNWDEETQQGALSGSLNIENYSAGLYFIRARSAHGFLTERFVKE